jgi:hypothetical protein
MGGLLKDRAVLRSLHSCVKYDYEQAQTTKLFSVSLVYRLVIFPVWFSSKATVCCFAESLWIETVRQNHQFWSA